MGGSQAQLLWEVATNLGSGTLTIMTWRKTCGCFKCREWDGMIVPSSGNGMICGWYVDGMIPSTWGYNKRGNGSNNHIIPATPIPIPCVKLWNSPVGKGYHIKQNKSKTSGMVELFNLLIWFCFLWQKGLECIGIVFCTPLEILIHLNDI